MKKNIFTIFIVSVSVIIFILGFNYKQKQDPNTFYKVYLKDEVIGVIQSKKKLEDYINRQNKSYREKYNVSSVNVPEGLEIKKITTYSNQVDRIEDVYKKLVDQEAFTVPGYQFTLRNEDRVTLVYVIDKEVFDEAVRTTMKTFVGTDDYTTYNETVQGEIITTGKVIEDIYVEETITTKKTNIPVTETIYTNAEELSQFLVFGNERKKETYTVKVGETITDIAYNHQISVEEFLISNTNFTSEKNLLFPGQEVTIEMTNPQISVAMEAYIVEDQETHYQTEYEYDENAVVGNDKVTRQGENGLERVSQKTKVVNGIVEYINILQRDELKPMINEIVVKGKKELPDDTGTVDNWYWPTTPGLSITSPYGYRIRNGIREFHNGLDIARPCGTPIYAVTNGRVVESTYHRINGNYVCINHNNGYYTCYNHMTRRVAEKDQIVARGDLIGYIGMTGDASGCHVHLEVWKGYYPWRVGAVTGTINPTRMYPEVFGR